jgi:hypothetical protein
MPDACISSSWIAADGGRQWRTGTAAAERETEDERLITMTLHFSISFKHPVPLPLLLLVDAGHHVGLAYLFSQKSPSCPLSNCQHVCLSSTRQFSRTFQQRSRSSYGKGQVAPSSPVVRYQHTRRRWTCGCGMPPCHRVTERAKCMYLLHVGARQYRRDSLL